MAASHTVINYPVAHPAHGGYAEHPSPERDPRPLDLFAYFGGEKIRLQTPKRSAPSGHPLGSVRTVSV